MINTSVKYKDSLTRLDRAIEKSLYQSVLLVHWKAVQNAPYKRWDLKRSLTQKVEKDLWRVWTKLKYWRIREYINKKNPHTRFYMKRALESSTEQIKWYFRKNINNL
jgi:hypothetical protein